MSNTESKRTAVKAARRQVVALEHQLENAREDLTEAEADLKAALEAPPAPKGDPDPDDGDIHGD